MKSFIKAFLAPLSALFLASCFNQTVEQPTPPTPVSVIPAEPIFVNPFPAGTHEHFTAEPNYRKTYNVYRNHDLLSAMTTETSSIRISLADQRAQLLHEGQVAMDYPISTGKSKHPTPTGSFQVLEKIKDKRSNIYGKFLDANGKVVNSNANGLKEKAPPGGRFLGASMPYWMRFTWDGIGHHAGNVPRYPASHGCIRAKRGTIPEIYAKVKIGTPVVIE